MQAYGDVQLVPPALVAAARRVLSANGINPTILQDNGAIAATDLIGFAFETVEVRTDWTPSTGPISLLGPQNPLLKQTLSEVKPAVILRGKAGTYVWAPYGVPTGRGLAQVKTAGWGIGAGLVGLLAGGWLFKKAVWG